MQSLFFELIRVAVGAQTSLSRIPTEREWGKLYRMAEKQSLAGVCFAALQRLGADADDGFARIGMSEMLYLSWMGVAATIQQRNDEVNQRCVQLQAMLASEGFRTYIMKGQGNSALYCDGATDLSCLRQSGDIDVYLEGGFDKVNAFVQRTHPTREVNELEIHYHCYPDTEVEIHYRPFIMRSPLKNRRLQRFFDSCAKACFAHEVTLSDGLSITAPTLEFNLVHQLVHIYHHFMTGGIGLRQLMDYYFVLQSAYAGNSMAGTDIAAPGDAGVPPSAIAAVSGLGLERFASALMWVLQQVFGLDEAHMPWLPDARDGRLLLDEIMVTGNFGHDDPRARGLHENKLKSFWYINSRTFVFWRFDRWAWFWTPLWRLYHFAWRRLNRYE